MGDNGVDPASFIEGSSKLTDIFGYWPSFHDAEIIDLSMWRGDTGPEEGAMLTLTIHLWEMTREVTKEGYLKCIKHTLAVLRFRDIHDFEMSGFNHQNAILGLSFRVEEYDPPVKDEPLPLYVAVEFDAANGMDATFRCFGVEVVSATPCEEDCKGTGK